MTLGLARDRLADRLFERLIIFGCTHHLAQIRIIILAEAHIKLPRAGQAHAIAALAKIMGERRDEADPLPGFLDTDIARRAARALLRVGQGPALLQPRTHILQRPELVEPIL